MASQATETASAEIELVLQLRAGAVERLARLGWLRPVFSACPEEIRTRYYDTGDLAFRRRGFAFRIREAGGRIMQTVKTAHGGSSIVKERLEFDSELTTAQPDPTRICDPATRTIVLEQMDVKPLRPVFETVISRRRAHVFLADGTHVEVAFDQGTLRAGARRLPVSELELELVVGHGDVLMALGLDIARRAPVRLGLASKAARGYGLVAEHTPRPVKASRARLTGGESVEEVFTGIVRSSLAQIMGNEAALDLSHPGAVHQMRVGLRRLRAGGGLFRGVLGQACLTGRLDDAKSLGLMLGPVRDLDVLLADILEPVRLAHAGDGDLEALIERAKAVKTEAWTTMMRTWRGTSDLADLVLSWELLLAQRPWRQDETAAERADAPAAPFAQSMVRRRWRKAVKLGRHLEALSIPERHELRIALKKMRYGCQFFQDLFERQHVKPWLAHLSALQDSFGALNDLAAAELILPRLVGNNPQDPGLSRAADHVLAWHREQADQEWERTRSLWTHAGTMVPFWENQPVG